MQMDMEKAIEMGRDIWVGWGGAGFNNGIYDID